MKNVSIAISILFVLVAVPALAQEKPEAPDVTYQGSISPGELTPTPEMWLYERTRSDHLDPKLAVRRKAEFRAAQRQQRIAAMKWFGFSNLRPHCSSDPFHGDWSASWRGNNAFYPSRWHGVGAPLVVVQPEYYFGTRVR